MRTSTVIIMVHVMSVQSGHLCVEDGIDELAGGHTHRSTQEGSAGGSAGMVKTFRHQRNSTTITVNNFTRLRERVYMVRADMYATHHDGEDGGGEQDDPHQAGLRLVVHQSGARPDSRRHHGHISKQISRLLKISGDVLG